MGSELGRLSPSLKTGNESFHSDGKTWVLICCPSGGGVALTWSAMLPAEDWRSSLWPKRSVLRLIESATSILDARKRSPHSITLPTLERLTKGPVSFSELHSAVLVAAAQEPDAH